MDCEMPILNGYEASKIISQISQNIKIIGITGNSSTIELDKCTEAGMKAVLVKPFSKDDFF